MTQSVARSVSGMAAATVVSRALGFVRTSVWAAALGLNIVGSAFLIANTLPNVIYILLAGGVLNAVFVPQLVRAFEQRDKTAERYVNALLTVATIVLALVTLLAVLFAPLLSRAYAGSNWSPADLDLATKFAYWCLPQIFFYGIYTIAGQVLNARHVFGPMMWAPVLNNVIAIAVGIGFIVYGTVTKTSAADASASVSGREAALLGLGATLGIVVQSLILVPYVRALGLTIRPTLRLRGTGIGHAGKLACWTIGFVAVNQVAFLVITRIANTASKDAQALTTTAVGMPAYSNAYLIFLLPHAIFTVSLVTALLPKMSTLAATSQKSELRSGLRRSAKHVAIFTLPLAGLFVALGPLVTQLVFFGNTAADARYIGLVLVAFAPSLPLFSVQYTLLRGFYSMEDTRTPLLIQCCIVTVNIAAALVISHHVRADHVVIGLAASYGLAYLVGLLLSTAILNRRLPGSRVQGVGWSTVQRLTRLAVPVAIATGAGYWASHLAVSVLHLHRLSELILAAAAGTMTFAVALLGIAALLGSSEYLDLVRTTTQRFSRRSSAEK